MAAPSREHVIFPAWNIRNPQIPVSNRFDGFEPPNMFENGEVAEEEDDEVDTEENDEVDFGIKKVHQGFKYCHDPSYEFDPLPPPPQPPVLVRPDTPPPAPAPAQPLVDDKEEDDEVDFGIKKMFLGDDPYYDEVDPLPPPPPPADQPLVDNWFRKYFWVMVMNWATAGHGWVFLFLAIGCCAFLLLRH